MGLSKNYLVAYNGVQVVGWAFILGTFFLHVTPTGATGASIYSSVGLALTAFQLLMILDVFHAIVRLVQSPPLTAALQVASRVFVVLVLRGFPESRSCAGLSLILAAWCPTEIIRYSYYAIRALGKADSAIPPQLLWLRYSSFIVLYPTGILGEIVILWNSLGQISSDQFWYPLKSLIYAVFAIYPIGSYFLYTYMLSQRKKALNPQKQK